MANSVRLNPLHSPAAPGLGTNSPAGTFLPQVAHVPDQAAGPMFAHLGHFGGRGVLAAGHNTSGTYRVRGKHPGFRNAQASIAKREGVSKKRAGAILASATRKASPAAKRANPRLNKVK